MDQDKKIEEQIKTYADLGKENPNIDVASLMLNALQTPNKNLVNSKSKKWAYFISIGAPPFGLFFAIKYYFSNEDDAKQVANMCIILTTLALFGLWFSYKTLLSGSGVSPQQLQQIKPQDVIDLTK
jgi:hypothetical protein